GADVIQAANGDNVVAPGQGADTIATGSGNDTVIIFDACELDAPKTIDTGTGTDTLITPVSLAELEARGFKISNVAKVIVQSNSCRSSCALPKPDCSGNGYCVEGVQAGQMTCACGGGFSGEHCEIGPSTGCDPNGTTCSELCPCDPGNTCQSDR